MIFLWSVMSFDVTRIMTIEDPPDATYAHDQSTSKDTNDESTLLETTAWFELAAQKE